MYQAYLVWVLFLLGSSDAVVIQKLLPLLWHSGVY